MLPFELGPLAVWTDHTWSKWVTAFICFSFRATDGKVLLSDPLIAPQSAVGKQSPMRRPRTRPHIHNLSERLPRFGLIKYSSGEIVDYAAAATIAASPARGRSRPFAASMEGERMSHSLNQESRKNGRGRDR